MKKITLLSLFAAVAFAAMAVSCKTVIKKSANHGSGLEASEKFISKKLDVKTVDEIDISGVVDVIYIQDGTTSAEIVVPDNVIEMYRYSAKGGKLKVWKESKENIRFKETNHPKLILHSPGLKEIELSGMTSFTTKSLMTDGAGTEFDVSGASSINIAQLGGEKISMDLSGASSMKVASVKVTNLYLECSGASSAAMVVDSAQLIDVDCSGASNVELTGTANTLILECSGASKINADKLVAETGKLDASGASKINANIKNPRSKEASGMSKVSNKSK
ncbi:MAG: DUF2807 domain-containing protein [Muribaculaceae bacterium]|nr:DUF2807 domain-containing protein [Muribaculaceae bacterium]